MSTSSHLGQPLTGVPSLHRPVRPPAPPSSVPPAEESSPHRWPLMDLVAAALIVILLAAGTWASYWADHRKDQYQLLQLGRCVYEGGRLYVDCWENKPPGIAWLSALGLVISGGAQLGAWLMPGIVALVCVGVVWIAATRLFTPTTARRTAGFAAFLLSLRLCDGTSINPDSYSAAFAVAAGMLMALAVQGRSPASRVAFGLIAGLFWAMSACVKQSGGAGVLVVALVCAALLLVRSDDRWQWVAATCGLVMGFGIGVGATAALLSRWQVLEPAWDAIFRFNRNLFAWESLKSAVASSGVRVRANLSPLGLPLWVGLFGLVATLLVGKARQVGRPVVIVGLIWWVLEVVLALAGPSVSMRYWQGTFGPLVLVAATGLFHIEELFRQLRRGYREAFVLISATVMFGIGRPFFHAYRLGIAESRVACDRDDNERVRLAAIGKDIAEAVPEDQRLYVLAYDPGLYVHSRRMPAGRFTYPRSIAQMDEIVAELSGGKAAVLLVPSSPAPEFKRFCDADCQQKLDAALMNDTAVATVGDYTLLRLRGTAGP